MGKNSVVRRGADLAARARWFCSLCCWRPAGRGRGPAPVVSGDECLRRRCRSIVQRGQTLSGIAQPITSRCSVVAEANHLSPPYRILVGQALIIPGGGEPALA